MAREHTQEFAAYICDRQSAELRREIRRAPKLPAGDYRPEDFTL